MRNLIRTFSQLKSFYTLFPETSVKGNLFSFCFSFFIPRNPKDKGDTVSHFNHLRLLTSYEVQKY